MTAWVTTRSLSTGPVPASSWSWSQTGRPKRLNLGVGGSADLSSLVPVPGGYDNQAYFNSNQPQRTEAAVYDPVAGVFTILGPNGTYTVHQRHRHSSQETFRPPLIIWGTGQLSPSCSDPVLDSSSGQGGRSSRHLVSRVISPWQLPCRIACQRSRPALDRDSGTTGTGSTGTGTTGTGSTGTGTTGTGSTGTGSTGTGSTGSGSGHSTGSSSSSGSRTSTPPPAQSPGSGLTHPGTSTHKKTVDETPSQSRSFITRNPPCIRRSRSFRSMLPSRRFTLSRTKSRRLSWPRFRPRLKPSHQRIWLIWPWKTFTRIFARSSSKKNVLPSICASLKTTIKSNVRLARSCCELAEQIAVQPNGAPQ